MHDYLDVFTSIDAQADELEKIAVSAHVGRLVGAGIGALGGAGVGAATAQHPEDRTRRAIGGAILGGIGGLVPGQFLTAQGQRQASRFGQRQLLGLTGAVKQDGKWTRLGKLTPQERLAAHERLRWILPRDAKKQVVRHAEDTPTALRELKGRIAGERGDVGKWFAGTRAGGAWEESRLRNLLLRSRIASERAQLAQVEKGETALPGFIRGYATTPLQTAKRALVAPGAVLGVGVPAAFAAPSMVEAARERDPRAAARTLAETAGYSLAGGLPMAAAMGVGTGASMLAGKVLGSPQSAAPAAAQTTAGRVVQQGELPRVRRVR